MFSKTVAAFALFTASAQVAYAAVPPACLLLALEGEKNPADLPTVCNADYHKMTSSLSAGCHSTALDGAMSAYSSVCKKTPKTSSSSSASKTSSESSASATDYRHISAHAHGTGSQTASSSMVVVTSVVYDEQCSCSKTTAITSMVSAAPSYVSSTGLAPYPVPHNGTASTSAAGAMGPAAGTGVLPVTSSATATGSSPPPNYTAAGVRTEMNLAGAAIAAGALAFLL